MAQDGMDFERNAEARQAALHVRPEPTRTQPIRNWNGIFASPAEATGEVPPSEPPASGARVSEPGVDSVRQGVAAGYRVIDEYLRQGRKAAQDFWSAGDAHQDDGDGAPSAGDASEPTAKRGPDVSKLGERWLRSLGEFGTNWLELMQAMSSRSGAAPAATDDETSAGPFEVGKHAPPATTHASNHARSPAATHAVATTPAENVPRVALAISSFKPVEVQVDIAPEAWEGELRVGPLADSDGQSPVIRGVKLDVSVDAVRQRCLRLEAVIAPDQPSGTYHGVVLAADRERPVGTLTLRVS